MTTEYKHTPDMGEISGFGGSYEAACQAMLHAGVSWLKGHPHADPRFHGFKGVYGLVIEDNDDAEALTKVIVDAAHGDLTGAMHHAVIARLLWIKANGWERYCEEIRKHELEAP